MEKFSFEELLYIVSGIIFLASLGVALGFAGYYVISDIILFFSILWTLSIFLFMRYMEKKDENKDLSENSENEEQDI